MNLANICWAVKQVAWAYIILHFDFHLGTLNVVPDWLGYTFIIHALADLREAEPSAELLRPLGILLGVVDGIGWFGEMLGFSMDIPIIGIFVSIISLYFHFQLLTNLAEISELYKCSETKGILRLRTIRTLLMSLFALPLPWEQIEIVSLILVLVNLVVGIGICIMLFSLKSTLEYESKIWR